MIISHSKKFCYWKIARTGSNTAELCIRMSNILDLEQDLVTSCFFFPAGHNVVENQFGHTTPSEAFVLGYLTESQYAEYDHYTTVRDPMERWVSAYAYRRANHSEDMTPQEFFDNHMSDLVQKRQSDYLANGDVTTFPFSSYMDSIQKLMCRIGGTKLQEIPRLKHKLPPGLKGIARRAIVDTRLGDDLRQHYSQDFLLDY